MSRGVVDHPAKYIERSPDSQERPAGEGPGARAQAAAVRLEPGWSWGAGARSCTITVGHSWAPGEIYTILLYT
eukprot:3174533-Heterocapsa_arctica.AAC.1